MKQHITPEEIKKDLTLKQRKKLAIWYYSKEWSASTPDVWLSIGQMIEFLDDLGVGGHTLNMPLLGWKGKICDVLWKEVKKVINDKT